MSQTLSLQQVTDKLVQLEQLVNAMREELTELRQQTEFVTEARTTKAQSLIPYPWIDKALQRYWIDQLYQTLSIQAEPIGAEALQQKMSEAGLAPNELSQSLIEAREK